jgi:3-oxoacyl-[acyl-carrier-protein] synthase II
MWSKLADRVDAGKLAIMSGATGTAPATDEEQQFLDQHPDIAVRATGTYLGHGFDAQFPMNVSLAALALSRGSLYPPGDDSGVERPMKGPLKQVLVTSVGHWRGEGIGLVEAVP